MKYVKKSGRFNNEIYMVFFLALSALGFMIFFVFNTSPMIKRFGEDSSMYLYMGRAMTEGKVLYRDIFDHKGPLIFFINYIGQIFIKGTAGVFIIEFIFLFLSMCLIYKTGKILSIGSLSVIPPLVYLWLYVTCSKGGNYTEGYCNLFSIMSLYIFARWDSENKALSKTEAFLLGVGLTFSFFMRPNNIAFILAVVIYIGIYSIKNNRKLIKKYIVYGLLGIATITLPILIYCLATGTLYDMIYATLLHNMEYCNVGERSFKFVSFFYKFQRIDLAVIILLNASVILSCISRENYTYLKFCILSMVIVTAAIIMGGYGFFYYYVLALPNTALSLILLLKNVRKKPKNLGICLLSVIILTVGFLHGYFQVEPLKMRKETKDYLRNTKKILSVIPKNELNSFFAYDIPGVALYGLDLPVPEKYFTMQTWMNKTNPKISEEICGFLSNNKPKWVFSYNRLLNVPENIKNILEENYEPVSESIEGNLYKRLGEE